MGSANTVSAEHQIEFISHDSLILLFNAMDQIIFTEAQKERASKVVFSQLA